MIARSNGQQVLSCRPPTGSALSWPRGSHDANWHLERWAAARDPPLRQYSSRQASRRRHDTGRARRPAQFITKIHPTSVRNGIAHGN